MVSIFVAASQAIIISDTALLQRYYNTQAKAWQFKPIVALQINEPIRVQIQVHNTGSVASDSIQVDSQVPQRAQIVLDSLSIPAQVTQVLISKDGQTYHSQDTQIPEAEIRYVRWQLYGLAPQQALDLHYTAIVVR